MTGDLTASGTVIPVPDDALSNTSYLIDVGGGQAVVVDPRRDIETYQALAAAHGLTLTTVLETHLHADFVSGARELADAGITVVCAAQAKVGFGHRGVTDGDRITLGGCDIEVLATPGHTPEHVAYLLHPPTGPARLFSGGSLIHGGAARTDLSGAERTAELTAAQYASLTRLGGLRADTWLHPTHGAGSFCSVGPAATGPTTLGAERQNNDLLTAATVEEFTARLLGRLGSYPPYFLTLRPVNQRGAQRRDALAVPQPLTAAEAAAAHADGAVIIDTRPLPAWSAGSPTGAVSNMLRPQFASWLGWIVPAGTPMIWLSTDPREAAQATDLAYRIGHDTVAGWIDGGMNAWTQAGLPTSTVALVTATGAAAQAEAGAQLLDVRQHSELATGVLPGSVHLELGDIIAGKTPNATRVVTYCGHGERSATAASLLAARGLTVTNLAGGTQAWTAAGLALT